MSKEHTPQPEQLTMEQVVSVASEVLLREGQHVPTLLVEGSQKLSVGRLPEMGATHDERLEQMFIAGATLALQTAIGDLKQVYLVTEAWMSQPQQGQTPTVLPSQDPQRTEVLLVSLLDVPTQQSSVVTLAMIRDGAGELIELQPVAQPGEEGTMDVKSPLLDAFVAGYQAAQSEKGI